MNTPAIPAPAAQPARTVMRGLALTAAAVLIALLPVVFGLALLASALAHRPLMAAVLRRWSRLTGTAPAPGPAWMRPAASRLTIVWGAVLLAVGLLQGIGAVAVGLSITDPASLAIRTLFALIVLVILSISTVAYLHRVAH